MLIVLPAVPTLTMEWYVFERSLTGVCCGSWSVLKFPIVGAIVMGGGSPLQIVMLDLARWFTLESNSLLLKGESMSLLELDVRS